jgi:hypothetical protein
MASKARRAAGTMTFVDVLLRWAFVRRRSAEGDRADLDAGHTLIVAAYSKSMGGEAMVPAGKGRQIARLKAGYLHLAAGRVPLWVERTGARQSTALVPPFSLRGEGERVPAARKFRRFKLVTGQGMFDLAVPLADVELVKYALSMAKAETASR